MVSEVDLPLWIRAGVSGPLSSGQLSVAAGRSSQPCPCTVLPRGWPGLVAGPKSYYINKCTYTHMCRNTCTSMDICIFAYTYICMYTSAPVCIPIYIYTYIYIQMLTVYSCYTHALCMNIYMALCRNVHVNLS